MRSIAFSLKDYPMGRARRVLNQRKLPFWLVRGNAAITGLVIYLNLLILLPGIERVMAPRIHLLAIFSAYALLIVSNILMMRRVSGMANASPLFSGNPVIRLTDAELILTSDEECLTRKWSAVTDVVTTRDGLVILSKGMSFIPIPTAAFADGAEMEAFAEAIRARIAPVKEPL